MKKMYFHRTGFAISLHVFRYTTIPPNKIAEKSTLHANDTRLGNTAYERTVTIGKAAQSDVSRNMKNSPFFSGVISRKQLYFFSCINVMPVNASLAIYPHFFRHCFIQPNKSTVMHLLEFPVRNHVPHFEKLICTFDLLHILKLNSCSLNVYPLPRAAGNRRIVDDKKNIRLRPNIRRVLTTYMRAPKEIVFLIVCGKHRCIPRPPIFCNRRECNVLNLRNDSLRSLKIGFNHRLIRTYPLSAQRFPIVARVFATNAIYSYHVEKRA